MEISGQGFNDGVIQDWDIPGVEAGIVVDQKVRQVAGEDHVDYLFGLQEFKLFRPADGGCAVRESFHAREL